MHLSICLMNSFAVELPSNSEAIKRQMTKNGTRIRASNSSSSAQVLFFSAPSILGLSLPPCPPLPVMTPTPSYRLCDNQVHLSVHPISKMSNHKLTLPHSLCLLACFTRTLVRASPLPQDLFDKRDDASKPSIPSAIWVKLSSTPLRSPPSSKLNRHQP